MNWEQFHYLCRVYSRTKFNTRPRLDEFLNSSKMQRLMSDFKDVNSTESPPDPNVSAILSELKSNEDSQTSAVSLYGCLDFSIKPGRIARLYRVKYYLLILAIAFISMGGVYYLFVYPSLSDLFERVAPIYGEQLRTFKILFPWISIAIVWLLAVCFLLSNQLSKAAAGELNYKKISQAFWANAKLKRAYRDLHDITSFPLSMKRESNIKNILSYTQDEEFIGAELNRLYDARYLSLYAESERVVRWIVSIVGAFISLAIYFFVKNAYQPLFQLGAII